MNRDTIALQTPQLVVSVTDPSLVNKLRNAIKMLNGVGSISIVKPKKTGYEQAQDDF